MWFLIGGILWGIGIICVLALCQMAASDDDRPGGPRDPVWKECDL